MISDLLERYHPDIFWWDSNNPYEEFAEKCNSLIVNSSSTIIQNNRISTLPAYQGDFETPEQAMDENTEYENMELCMTLNGSWGYNQFDTGWKEPEFILWCLLRANKLGGNLLLNVGPRADGTIPEQCQIILEKVGQWVNENSDGIYGTRKSPFRFNLPYGPTTWRKKNGSQHLFYHIFYWDGSGELWLPGIMNATNEVELSFPSSPQLSFKIEAIDGVGLHLTGLPQKQFSDKMCTMLDIKFKSEPRLIEGTREINNILQLDALGAQIGNVRIDDFETKPCINWYEGRRLTYKIHIKHNDTYKISTLLAGYSSGTITFNFGNEITLTGNNQATPGGHTGFVDKSQRLCATTKGIYHMLSTDSPYKKDDMVSGRVYDFSDNFGTFIAVDDKYSAKIPVFENAAYLKLGDVIEAKVTDVKADGKLDLTMREKAYIQMDSDAEKLLELLDSYAGVLPFSEKASPEVIKRETGLSKNAFKRAVGRLYKERKIDLTDGKIWLLS